MLSNSYRKDISNVIPIKMADFGRYTDRLTDRNVYEFNLRNDHAEQLLHLSTTIFINIHWVAENILVRKRRNSKENSDDICSNFRK